MSDLTITNSVFGKLTADSIFLGYLGLTVESSESEKAARIQREIDPEGLSLSTIPLVCIYPVPGARPKGNNMIYDAMFEVAVYSSNSNGAAGTMLIGERARDLLHQIELGGATFNVEFQTSYQYSSDISGIKKYVMRFLVSEVIG